MHQVVQRSEEACEALFYRTAPKRSKIPIKTNSAVISWRKRVKMKNETNLPTRPHHIRRPAGRSTLIRASFIRRGKLGLAIRTKEIRTNPLPVIRVLVRVFHEQQISLSFDTIFSIKIFYPLQTEAGVPILSALLIHFYSCSWSAAVKEH